MPRVHVHRPTESFTGLTSDRTISNLPGVYAGDASLSSPLIITLPPAIQAAGQGEFTFVNVGTSGTVIVDAYSTETIDGALTYNLPAQWDTVTIVSVGNAWVLAGGGGGGEIYSDTVPNLGVTTFQGAIESLLVGAPSTTFIYNSSGIQGGTRYNNWANLMTAIGDSRYGGPRNIVFEQNETIPVGTHDLTNITLLGNDAGIQGSATQTIVVTFPTGCTLNNSMKQLSISNGLCVRSTSIAPIIQPTQSFTLFLSKNAAIGSTTCEFIQATVNNQLIVLFVDGGNSTLLGRTVLSAGTPSLTVSGYEIVSDNSPSGAQIVLAGAGLGSWDYAGTVRGAAGGGVLIWASIHPAAYTMVGGVPSAWNTPGGNPNYLSPVQVTFNSMVATNLPYSPAVLADWSGTAPTSISNALDRIAAKITPIP